MLSAAVTVNLFHCLGSVSINCLKQSHLIDPPHREVCASTASLSQIISLSSILHQVKSDLNIHNRWYAIKNDTDFANRDVISQVHYFTIACQISCKNKYLCHIFSHGRCFYPTWENVSMRFSLGSNAWPCAPLPMALPHVQQF